jgi:hypothetical protein
MATTKDNFTHVEVTPGFSQTHHADELYEYSDGVLLDLAAGKTDPDLANTLKLAKDGHVRCFPKFS